DALHPRELRVDGLAGGDGDERILDAIHPSEHVAEQAPKLGETGPRHGAREALGELAPSALRALDCARDLVEQLERRHRGAAGKGEGAIDRGDGQTTEALETGGETVDPLELVRGARAA